MPNEVDINDLMIRPLSSPSPSLSLSLLFSISHSSSVSLSSSLSVSLSLSPISSFQEIYPPKVSEFTYVTDGGCTVSNILDTELIICNVRVRLIADTASGVFTYRASH